MSTILLRIRLRLIEYHVRIARAKDDMKNTLSLREYLNLTQAPSLNRKHPHLSSRNDTSIPSAHERSMYRRMKAHDGPPLVAHLHTSGKMLCAQQRTTGKICSSLQLLETASSEKATSSEKTEEERELMVPRCIGRDVQKSSRSVARHENCPDFRSATI